MQGWALHRDSGPSTTGYHHWLCLWRKPWKGLRFQVFIQSSSFQWWNMFFVMLAQHSLHITLAAHFPDVPEGESCPKRLGSAAAGAAGGLMVLVSERCAHCYKLMEIGFKRTQVVAIDLAVSWEPGKSRANGWAAEQKELFRLHVAKKHLSAWETQPVGYHAVAHSGYLWSQFNFLFYLRAFFP